MNHEKLLANFRRHVAITAADEKEIIPLITGRTFKKGQFITTAGEINKYTNYILSGSVRVYYIDNNGHEHNIQLGIADWWTGDFPSFITQQPGELYTEALEPTDILAFSQENLQVLYDKVPRTERFFRLIIQKAYASFQQRVLSDISYSAEQRYLAFRMAYPDMDRQISQKHIASYLGMSAEFLSKIKKRLAFKDRNKLKNLN